MATLQKQFATTVLAKNSGWNIGEVLKDSSSYELFQRKLAKCALTNEWVKNHVEFFAKKKKKKVVTRQRKLRNGYFKKFSHFLYDEILLLSSLREFWTYNPTSSNYIRAKEYLKAFVKEDTGKWDQRKEHVDALKKSRLPKSVLVVVGESVMITQNLTVCCQFLRNRCTNHRQRKHHFLYSYDR